MPMTLVNCCAPCLLRGGNSYAGTLSKSMVRLLKTPWSIGLMYRSVFLCACAALTFASISPSALADEPTIDGPASVTQSLTSWYDQNIPSAFRVACPLLVHEMTESALIDYINSGSGAHQSKTSTVSNTDDIDGVYDRNPPRIAVEIEQDGKVDDFTFAHEYGHYVWFELMTKADRRAYEAVYKQSKSDKHLVTDYAAVSVDEGFAEAFSFYVNLPQDLQYRDADSYDFLSNWSQSRHSSNARFEDQKR